MRIPVFLSYSSTYTDSQKEYIEGIQRYLRKRGFEPRTLGETDYDADEPLTAIRRLMLESNGVLVVAFKRFYIEKGSEKPGSFAERNLSDNYMTSPWCHIEPAMAFQLGLPVLVFREKGVIENGVLEKGVIGTYLPEVDTARPINDYLESEEWNQILGVWEGYVRAVRKAKGTPPKLY